MQNRYTPPRSPVDDVAIEGENNSGSGSGTVPPDGVKGWSWGGLLLNWIWAIGNKTYIGLLAAIPYLGFLVAIYLGVKGRELAWQNKRWESLDHFNKSQRRWSIWGGILIVGGAALAILAAIAIPAYQGYARRRGAG